MKNQLIPAPAASLNDFPNMRSKTLLCVKKTSHLGTLHTDNQKWKLKHQFERYFPVTDAGTGDKQRQMKISVFLLYTHSPINI